MSKEQVGIGMLLAELLAGHHKFYRVELYSMKEADFWKGPKGIEAVSVVTAENAAHAAQRFFGAAQGKIKLGTDYGVRIDRIRPQKECHIET